LPGVALAVLVLDGHEHPKVDLPVSRSPTHDRELGDSLIEPTQTPINLTEPSLPILVLRVLRAIPMSRRDRDLLGHPGPLNLPQFVKLSAELRVADRRNLLVELRHHASRESQSARICANDIARSLLTLAAGTASMSG